MGTRFAVVGTAEALRPAAVRAAAAACHLGVPAHRRDDVELAVHETLANACEHGHLGDAARAVTVEVVADGLGTVSVRVGDDALGGGWDPAAGANDTTSLERGRGTLLVRALVDGVTVTTRPDATIVALRWSTAPDDGGTPPGRKATVCHG